MSVVMSYLEQFPMEKLLLSVQNIPLAILIVGLLEFIFFQIDINYWFQRVCKHFSRSFSSIHYQTLKLSDILRERVGTMKVDDFELTTRNPLQSEQVDDGSLCREDMEMVMGRLGFICHPRQHKERLCLEYFSSMFDENEPSLDEVKEAFDVFDLNRDGFIDAMELQRVVCALGLSDDGSQIENCKQMIREFDENRDGKIDFREFVKLMENSFC